MWDPFSVGRSPVDQAPVVLSEHPAAGTIDVGAGYGFQIGKITPHVNWLWEKSSRVERQISFFEGFEYQITDDANNPDAKANGPKHRTAALYDMFAASKEVTKPVGEFNHGRIIVKGDHVEHWLNGEKVVDGSLKAPEVAKGTAARWGADSPVYDLLVNQPRKECQISLQNHGSDAWFKNIKIRRL